MSGNYVRLFLILASLQVLFGLPTLPNAAVADSAAAGPSGKVLQGDKVRATGVTLAQSRNLAALRGLQWMDAFLDEPEHFRSMPFETFHFFSVCALTSTHPKFRSMAKKAADKYAARLKKHCLDLPDPMGRYEFLQLLEFLSKLDNDCGDYALLLEKAKRNYGLYHNTADLYGTPVDHLGQADWKVVYETLLYAYFLEKIDVKLPGVFKADYRLADIFRFLKSKDYIDFKDDTAEDKKQAVDDAFLITHIAYMLSNYSQLRLREKDAPWLYDYLRRNFNDILAMGHTDLIGECVDIFRSLGYTEDNCEIVRKGTVYLLERQNAEGAWGTSREQVGSAYDLMHPTSCAIWAMRTRTFVAGTKYEKRIRRLARELK